MPPDIECYSAVEFAHAVCRGHAVANTRERTFGVLHHADDDNTAAISRKPLTSALRMSGAVTPIGQRISGAPGAIRTPDPQIRSLMLYPAELRVRGKSPLDALFQGRKCVARFFCAA